MTHEPTTADTHGEARIEALLEAMTVEEKVLLLSGANFWETHTIERLGIPAIKVSDGPNGARGGGTLIGGVKAACFPVGIGLGASWNPALITEIGRALGQEAQSKGASMLLAPTVNIHRSPLNGRNFECYSEDPYLSARIAVAYINGLQAEHVGATVKHYVCNDSEFERNSINSEVDERTLREIYLPPFRAAVEEAQSWGVMAAYNKVNGTFAAENRTTLIDILKDEWGFDGLVMSDWYGTKSTVDAANNGLDLEMPGPAMWRGEKLLAAVEAGEVDMAAINEAVRRVLRIIERSGAFERTEVQPEQAIDRPEHRALIRRAAAEGAVLLKNVGNVLPLDADKLTTIALIGPNAKTAQIMGGGSAQVNAHYRVSPFEGVQAQVGEQIELGYELGCTNYRYLPLLTNANVTTPEGEPGLAAEYFNSHDLSGEAVFRDTQPVADIMWFHEVRPGVNPMSFSARFTTRYVPSESGEHQFSLASAGVSRLFVDGALVVDNWEAWQQGDSYFSMGSSEAIGTTELEAGRVYDVVIEYATPHVAGFGMRAWRAGVTRPVGEAALERAEKLAASADVAVVFVGLNGEWETEGNDRANMELVGDQNELIARVAAANPQTVVVLQTGSPVTMPWLGDVAAVVQAWYPGQECGNGIADVLFGRVNPSGKLPQTFPLRLEDNPAFINYPGENGRVRYGEGLFVGYRYYEKKRVEPLFPFGYGLSYTSFAFTNLRLSADVVAANETVIVHVDVTNTGERAGQEVVQVYVRDVASRLTRPLKELKGFAKLSLEPGETQTAVIALDYSALAYWDDAEHAWVAEPGEFEVLVGNSSQDIYLQASFRLE